MRELAAKALTNLSIPDAAKAALARQGAAPVLVALLRAGGPRAGSPRPPPFTMTSLHHHVMAPSLMTSRHMTPS